MCIYEMGVYLGSHVYIRGGCFLSASCVYTRWVFPLGVVCIYEVGVCLGSRVCIYEMGVSLESHVYIRVGCFPRESCASCLVG